MPESTAERIYVIGSRSRFLADSAKDGKFSFFGNAGCEQRSRHVREKIKVFTKCKKILLFREAEGKPVGRFGKKKKRK